VKIEKVQDQQFFLSIFTFPLARFSDSSSFRYSLDTLKIQAQLTPMLLFISNSFHLNKGLIRMHKNKFNRAEKPELLFGSPGPGFWDNKTIQHTH
jgi:hypothetical protein